jgi:twitching motility protein PilT
MLKIDFYIQQLARYNAHGVVLTSGKPVLFRFPDGDRETSKAIEHTTLSTLVQEIASAQTLDALRSGGKARIPHAAEEGPPVFVSIDIQGPGNWIVTIDPEGEGGEAEAAPPAPPAPRARIAPPMAAPAPAPTPMASPAAPAVVASAMPARPQRPAASAISLGTDVEMPASPPPRAAPVAQPRAPEPEPPKAKEPERAAGNGIRIELSSAEPRINHFLRLMKAVDASDLHLSSGVVPMVRRHGEMVVLEDRAPMTDNELRTLIDEIIPNRNRADLENNDADFAHAIPGLCRFRANVFIDRRGMGAVFRQIPFEIVSAEKLGVPKRVLDLCWLTKGLVLVTGPTGSGKSTTLASLIDYINVNRNDHIITIEDPVEFVHDNKKCLVNQREIGTHTKSFKSALRAALREDPDIVLVGEMRDLETIAIAIETAETGHLVFGTLHTTSAVSTVDRIIDQFPSDQQAQIRVMLSESLRGVVAQVSNSACANLIREGKTFQLKSVMQTGRNLGMQTMNDHLLDHVKKGLVEPQEAYMKSNDKILMKEALAREGHKLEIME